MKTLITLAALAIAALSTGCASIVNGANQSLSVETRSQGIAISGAQCKLDNGKGVWYVTTPGSVTVHRAFDNMNISCQKLGYTPPVTSIPSTTKGMAFGNILFGGVIGVAIDAGSGAAYDYPNLLIADLGAPTALPVSGPLPTSEQLTFTEQVLRCRRATTASDYINKGCL